MNIAEYKDKINVEIRNMKEIFDTVIMIVSWFKTIINFDFKLTKKRTV